MSSYTSKLVHMHWVLWLILSGIISSYGQNLVRNPSFEVYAHCPQKLGNLKHDLLEWTVPSLGSTDYFNACSEAMGTPKNFNGEQPADFGDGYVGMYLYAPDDYREYLQANLTQTLKKEVEYTLSFYVSLAERSDFAIREFGVLFSENPIQVATRKVLSKMHLSKIPGDVSNYHEIIYSDFYTDASAWVKVELDFVARGTENFVIIGNFKDNDRTRKFKTKRKATKGSYYYMDMVAIVPNIKASGANETLQEEALSTDFSFNTANTLKHVLFPFNEDRLTEQAIQELDGIVGYLKSRPEIHIAIAGHTDNMGSPTYNQKLSEKRAEAVANYLLAHGVQAHRVSSKGYGSSKPLATNGTEKDRRKNRRVEFTLLKDL